MTWIEALILAIIEGITEFLPVSSTGHMIIASAFMGIINDPFTKVFEVAIQFGAILSVVVLYFKRFFKGLDFYYKLFVAFLPTAIVGLLLKSHIDALLENVWVVATTLLLGGIVLIFVDKWFEKNETEGIEEVSYKTGFLIGCFQCLAMIPGMSRSAATIIGGLTQKLTRKAAAEFSFFLAVPTMFAATAKSLYDEKDLILESADKIPLLIFGNVIAFIVAMLAIKFFINILTKYGFKVFGYYRIVLGLLLLTLLLMNVDLAVV
ncbi:undecaprenyl-diphosphate phosphatase [uncultured Cytophaga sp.]|uniref:undecaprenyl-diphosphate phosphatase n=1 Tax=uncultured Cytophaga sp. TaxID=160238 RepID=UPI002635AE9F|nr:undecaprenyl-diphosphate phosphatase [uncultured Cytophaga sp.]